MATSVTTNGIDVTQLVQTIEAIKYDSSLASFTFCAETAWQESVSDRGQASAAG